jgi:hypothetical protein
MQCIIRQVEPLQPSKDGTADAMGRFVEGADYKSYAGATRQHHLLNVSHRLMVVSNLGSAAEYSIAHVALELNDPSSAPTNVLLDNSSHFQTPFALEDKRLAYGAMQYIGCQVS